MFVLPAWNVGLERQRVRARRVPFGTARDLELEEDSTGGLPDHGVNDALVVYVPHNAGVASGAREPPKKWSSRSSNGRCGVFFERRDELAGHRVRACTCPANLTSTPDTGSSRNDIQRDQRPERVRILRRQIRRTDQRVRQQRRMDFDRRRPSTLPGTPVLPRFPGQFRFRARTPRPIRTRGVQRDTRRQRHRRVPHRRLRISPSGSTPPSAAHAHRPSTPSAYSPPTRPVSPRSTVRSSTGYSHSTPTGARTGPAARIPPGC